MSVPIDNFQDLNVHASTSERGCPVLNPRLNRGRVMVIEDEPDIARLIRLQLAQDGFEVTCYESGEEGFQAAFLNPPDLLVLDLMLPGMGGRDVCRGLRAQTRTASLPILILTAKSTEPDVIEGLKFGADDYMTKPFSPKVLSARVQALLRRAKPNPTHRNRVSELRQGDLVLKLDTIEAFVGSTKLELTATEFQMLKMFISEPHVVMPRDRIVKELRGPIHAVSDRSVDFQVVNLRRKLGDLSKKLKTVRGFGYKFVP